MSTPTIDVPETAETPEAPGAAAPAERRDGLLRGVLASPLVWPALSLGVLLVVTGLLSDNFFTIRLQDGNLYGALVDIVRNGSPVLMVAIGLTLVIATRGIDLSVGAIAAISASIAAVQIVGSADEGAASAAVLGMAMALAVAVLLGLWNGFLVSVLGIQPIIATLVLLVAGRGIAMLVSDGQITTVNNATFSAINGFVLSLPVAFVIAFGLYVATTLLVRRTALGMLIEAVGINPEASRLAGVRSRTIIWTVYVFSGLCAGVAGLVIAANTNSVNSNNLGLWIELDAILAVVIGGTSLAGGRFSLTGTLLGALLIATLSRTIPAIGIPSEANYLVKALVVIAVCLLQSPRARAALRVRRHAPVAPATRKAAVR